MTVTPAAMSAQGWVSGPSLMAYQGVMLSMPVCHLGGFFGGFGLPSFLYCRIAITVSPTPMASLAARAASEGAVLGFGGLLPVTRTVNAITIASDSSQPKMNAAPFRTPPLDARTRMNAVSGSGSSVTRDENTNIQHQLRGRGDEREPERAARSPEGPRVTKLRTW